MQKPIKQWPTMVTEGWAPICVDLKFVLASGILKEKTERDSQVIKSKIDRPLIYYFKCQKLSSSAIYATEKCIPACSLFTTTAVPTSVQVRWPRFLFFLCLGVRKNTSAQWTQTCSCDSSTLKLANTDCTYTWSAMTAFSLWLKCHILPACLQRVITILKWWHKK